MYLTGIMDMQEMEKRLMRLKYITIHRLLMQISMDIRKLNTELP